MRPTIHICAPVNWLNDPNGLIYWQGRYHVFYQHNPDAPQWGPMHWGHTSSADLLTWIDHGIALTPSPDGPDRDGCWSGSIVVIDGTPTAYYTGASGEGQKHVQSVCRATSSGDLTTWRKDPANPIIDGAPRPGRQHQRDPFIVSVDGRWLMLLATGLLDGDGGGAVVASESTDLQTWRDTGTLFSRPAAEGPVWEVPQLIRLGDRWVLIVSIQLRGGPDAICDGAVWFAGDIVDGRFVASSSGRIDAGTTFYAPAVLTEPGGRHLMWAWLQDPTPDLSSDRPVVGALSLPRILEFSDDRLLSWPAPELDGLATGAPAGLKNVELPAGEERRLASPEKPDDAFRVRFEVEPTDGSHAGSDGFAGVRLLAARDGSRTVAAGVEVNDTERRLVFLETRDDAVVQHIAAELPDRRGSTAVDVFVDTSIVEVFAEGASITARVVRDGLTDDHIGLISPRASAHFKSVSIVRLAAPR